MTYFTYVDATRLKEDYPKLVRFLESERIVDGEPETTDGLLEHAWPSPGEGIDKAAKEFIHFEEEGDPYGCINQIAAWGEETTLPLNNVGGNPEAGEFPSNLYVMIWSTSWPFDPREEFSTLLSEVFGYVWQSGTMAAG